MREGLKRLVKQYLFDAALLEGTRKEIGEEIEEMSKNFVDDVQRLLSARKDFTNGDSER